VLRPATSGPSWRAADADADADWLKWWAAKAAVATPL